MDRCWSYGAAARLGMKRTTLQAKMRESFARHRSVIRVWLLKTSSAFELLRL
jgi:hypothetical protein